MIALTLALGLSGAAGCSVVSQGQNAEGVRLYQQGQYQSAVQHFQQAITDDPNNADGYYNLASTYHKLGTLNHQPKDLDQAETLYNQCLDRNADHADCRRALAVLLVERSRSEEAMRMLEGWAQRSPTIAAPRIELARLSQELGDRTKARTQLLEAINLDPYNSRALTALGRLNEEDGKPAQALSNYERSLATNNSQPEVMARVAALRSTLAGTPGAVPPGGTPPDGTRTVSTPTPAVR